MRLTVPSDASKRPRPFGPGYFSIRIIKPLRIRASKRPRPFGPGYHCSGIYLCRILNALQRGPGLLAQDTSLTDQFDASHGWLQRGPGLLAQDTRIEALRDRQVIRASKRPRPFGPGYQITSKIQSAKDQLLQRGPGLLAQDTCICDCLYVQISPASKRPRPFGPGYPSNSWNCPASAS